MRRFLEIFLLVAGLTGVGIWIWSNVRMSQFQKQANHALERSLTLHPPSAPPLTLPSGALVGRLVIPRLNLQAVVREGAGESTLNVALGHIPGTALPGQPGNAGIAGHRDTLFRGLRNIKDDDLIQLETPSGTFAYKVENTNIVKPTDVEVLRATRKPELTLVTCYPFYYVGPAPNRFIVKARLVDSSVPPASSAAKHEAGRHESARKDAPGETVARRDPPDRRSMPAPVQSSAPKTASVKRVPAVYRTAKPPADASPGRVMFQVNQNHSRMVAPGILIGLSATDTSLRRASGWIWIGPERRTIYLRNQAVNQPIVFRGYRDGKPRKLVLTSVTRDSASGYMSQMQ